jgi:hypothetical protein
MVSSHVSEGGRLGAKLWLVESSIVLLLHGSIVRDLMTDLSMPKL